MLKKLSATPSPAAPLRDIPYGPLAQHTLDLYPSPGSQKLVVFIHGGGWHSGDKRALSPLLIKTLNRRGIALASLNFRQPQVDLTLADLRLALKFLRRDWPSISLMGASSGGHLAALLATTEAGIHCVIDKCGPSDLTLGGANPIQAYVIFQAFGSPPGPALKTYSPVHQVHPGCPPFLLIHGDRDNLVPLSQSRALAASLKAQNVEVELLVVEHAGHDFSPVGGAPSLSESQLADHIGDFILKH